MNTMLRWSPTRQFHYDGRRPSERFSGGARMGPPQRPWLPRGGADGGWHYVIQLALPGVDSKDVKVSLMTRSSPSRGERQADHDTAGKAYFVREVAYARSSEISPS